jgi:hypothetical protein
MTHRIKTFRIAALAVLALTLCAATASAAGGLKYDAQYGTGKLAKVSGSSYYPINSCEATNNHSLAVSATLSGGSQPLSTKKQITGIAGISTTRPASRKLNAIKSGVGEKLVASDFAASGAFAYVDSPVLDRKASKFVVRKATITGKPYPGWHDVHLTLPGPAKGGSFGEVNVLNLADGGVLVSISRFDALRIFRYTSSGGPAVFGNSGVVTTAPMAQSSWYLPNNHATPLLETFDGSLIVAAPGRPGQPKATTGIGLLKLDKSGAVVDGFADHGFWIPPTALAEEKPLFPSDKRLAPEAMKVVRGSGTTLTVLFATRVEFDTGDSGLIAAAQLTDAGVQTAVSQGFDTATNAGDGGFPDAQPFDFRAAGAGFNYAAAQSQFSSANSGATFGKLVELGPALAPPIEQSKISLEGKFVPFDFAATTDGKYLWACGGYAPKKAKSGIAPKTFQPALRLFKL